MVERIDLGDVATAFSDHGDELALIVEMRRDARAHDRRAGADEARVEAVEQGGVVGLLEAELGGVVTILTRRRRPFRACAAAAEA